MGYRQTHTHADRESENRRTYQNIFAHFFYWTAHRLINQEKKITTKDKKGNPTQFSVKLIVAVSVNNSFNQIEQQTFRESSSYKNNENKFDLKNYEDSLVQNMSEKIISDIIFFIQNLD